MHQIQITAKKLEDFPTSADMEKVLLIRQWQRDIDDKRKAIAHLMWHGTFDSKCDYCKEEESETNIAG